MRTFTTGLVISALAAVALATLPAPSRAQEIPQPITRPCKHPCPNRIRFAPAPGLDSLELHARIIPQSSIDPAFETFFVELSDANGNVFFAVSVSPGDMKETNGGRRAVYRNPAARSAGGVYQVTIMPRHDAIGGYRVDVRAYGDLSGATMADITTAITIGDDPFFDNGPWTQRSDGWVRDFIP
jgi:hypothetical protein